MLVLNACEIEDSHPIDWAGIRWDVFGVMHREVIAACKKLQSLRFLAVEKVQPGF